MSNNEEVMTYPEMDREEYIEKLNELLSTADDVTLRYFYIFATEKMKRTP